MEVGKQRHVPQLLEGFSLGEGSLGAILLNLMLCQVGYPTSRNKAIAYPATVLRVLVFLRDHSEFPCRPRRCSMSLAESSLDFDGTSSQELSCEEAFVVATIYESTPTLPL